MNPWEESRPEPEERWHRWFAWRPVTAFHSPGHIAVVFLESVWRRRNIEGIWEYQVYD